MHSFFKAHRYDVAVLTLSRRVPYQPHIQPICLPDKGDYAVVAGWDHPLYRPNTPVMK
ncbi:hypothetical protein QYM36_012457 [Artemia franciscana]|uniref:Peptidase S1 domain-containing protein n=1 Tax=Artemia franciscana TaxID=6661 RepID=A0AA88HP64_ARTSF|nr:hypothetical protein QYM36_012457 [Artemia franciscana]